MRPLSIHGNLSHYPYHSSILAFVLLKLMFSLFQAHGEKESSLVVNDGARNSSQNNMGAGIKVYLADSKVSMHPVFHDILMSDSLTSMQEMYTLRKKCK